MQIAAGSSATLPLAAGSRLVLAGAGTAQVLPPVVFPLVTIGDAGTAVGPFERDASVLVRADRDVAVRTLQDGVSTGPDGLPLVRYGDDRMLLGPGGEVLTLARAVELATNVTATGTSRTGAGYFAGIFVSAYDGGPQTITARDSTDNSGRIIGVFTVSATGYYWLDAAAVNSVRILAGVHLTISGGTSRTVAAVVEP
jgi:hypothetical protein